MALSSADIVTPLADRLAQLPPFYGYKDVLTRVFSDDEDAFLDAWCDGRLPLAVRQTCAETMGDLLIQTWLLRRVVRQLTVLCTGVRV